MLKRKKIIYTLLSAFFVSGSFAQMRVHGDVINVGNARVNSDLIMNAAHDGSANETATETTGVMDNQATSGKLNVIGSLVLHSVSWDLNHDNAVNEYGADGILVSYPAPLAPVTKVAGAKVVKHFKSSGYYLITFPFDVPAMTGITNSRNGQYYPKKVSTPSNTDCYRISYYNSEKRAQYGLLGATVNGGVTNQATSGWIWFGSDNDIDAQYPVTTATGNAVGSSPELKAGQLYQIFINRSGTYTFTAKTADNHLDNLYGTVGGTDPDHHRKTPALAYQTADYHDALIARKNYNYGWHAIGAMQTAPFHVNPSEGATNVVSTVTNNVYVYNYSSEKWEAINISGTNNDLNVSVAPYAGMMVQISDSENHTGTLSFDAAGRINAKKDHHFRSSTAANPYIQLQLYDSASSDEKYADVLRVILKEGSSNDFKGGEDGLKFFGGTAPEFGTVVPNAGSTVTVTNDFRAAFAEKEEIPISLWIKKTGNYTIRLKSLEGFTFPVYLVDKTGKTLTELTPDVAYKFQAQASEQPIENRFVLRAGGTTEIPASVFNKILVYAADNQVCVKNATEGDLVSVYNVAGQLVETLHATSSETSVVLPAKGVYIVKVSGAESVVTKIINK